MDVSILANLFLFLGVLGVNLALDGDSSDPTDNDPLYTEKDYSSRHDGTRGDDDITTIGESEAWFMAGGHDHLTGSAGNDYANMGDGNDAAEMGAGSDIALGGAGSDIALGGAGHDSLAGGTGNDKLFGGSDDDHLWGNSGDDGLSGGSGNDWLTGGSGADTILGGEGNDLLSGYSGDAAGANGMTTPEGMDQLFGGDGNDTILLGHGDGAVGGAGADTFQMDHRWGNSPGQFHIVDFDRSEDQLQLHYIPRYSSDTSAEILPDLRIELSPDGESSIIRMNGSVIAQLDGVTDLKLSDIHLTPDTNTDPNYLRSHYDAEVITGDGNDLANGDSTPTAWFTGGGADSLTGSGGDDYAQLGSGDDHARMAQGQDSLHAGTGNDSISGGDGNDTLLGDQGDDTLDGDAGNDRILGEDGNDLLTGGAGADSLIGGGGNDTISGYQVDAAGEDSLTAIDGIDTLSGGAGNDLLIVGRGDIALGGTGNDTFAIDDRWHESPQVAVINDYVKGEDHLEIYYTPTFDSNAIEVPPVLTVVAGPGNAYAILNMNGAPVAHIMGGTSVTLAEVTLIRDPA